MLGLLPLAASHIIPALTLFVVSAGLLVLGAADIWREEVEDYATVALLLITVAALVHEGISPQQWLAGALSAAVVFLFYLSLGVHGLMGGGDVKLSAVPALVLGASMPLLGLWWAAASVVIQYGFFAVAGRLAPGSTTPGLPHVPAMAVAFVLAWAIFVP